MTRCSIINDFFVLNTFFFIMLFSWIHHEFFKRGYWDGFFCLFVWRKIITLSDMIFCKIKEQERGDGRSGFFPSSSAKNISRFNIIWNHERQNPEPKVWSLQCHFGILRRKPVWLNWPGFSRRLHHCLHFLKPLNHEWIRLKIII